MTDTLHSSNETLTANDPWVRCEPGTITQAAKKVRGVHLRHKLTNVAILLVFLGSLISVGRSWSPLDFGPDYGGISCTEVKKHLVEYRSQSLDPAMSKRIAKHLVRCPYCRALARSEKETILAYRRIAANESID